MHNNIPQLIDDSWDEIFSFLTLSEQMKLCNITPYTRAKCHKFVEKLEAFPVTLNKKDLSDYIEMNDEEVVQDSLLRFITQLELRYCKVQPEQLQIILQHCPRLERLTIRGDMHKMFSTMPHYPTENIPRVAEMTLLGEIEDEDLFHISASMPNLHSIDLLYDCNGFSVVGAMWIDCYADIDINSTMDFHVYCVQAFSSDKNESFHYR